MRAANRWLDWCPIPGTYQAYLDLGRFCNASSPILNQANIHPTAGLTDFIDGFRLQSYQVATALWILRAPGASPSNRIPKWPMRSEGLVASPRQGRDHPRARRACNRRVQILP